jgi:hypothetical protein
MARAELSCRGTAKDVDLVPRRHGDQKIGALGTRLAQRLDGGAVARDAKDVTAIGDLGKRSRVLVDNRDRMVFRGKLHTDGGADRTASNDDDFHVLYPFGDSLEQRRLGKSRALRSLL